MYYPPQTSEPDALILHIPAFAEEMNKSRRMVALQATALSHHNNGVLVLDLFGTGDSEGLLEYATWQLWMEDIESAVRWLLEQYSRVPVYLWGLRFGCALVVDYVSQADTSVHGMLLWQPLLSAKMMLAQFLRLRVASAMTSHSDNEHTPETTKTLLDQLENGIAVEVGGYLLSPEFYASLPEIDAVRLSFKENKTILWVDFSAGENAKPSTVNRPILNAWTQRNNQVTWAAVNGDRFWNTQEIALCPELIARTTQLLCVDH